MHSLASLIVGGLSRAELVAALAAGDVATNTYADQLLQRPEIEVAAQTVDLVAVQVGELVGESGGTHPQILAAASARGWAPSSLATGPYLRLRISERESTDPELRRQRPPEGALHVAGIPPSADPDAPRGFYLRTVGGVSWLRGYRCDDDYVLPPDATFVFAVSRT